MRGISWHLIRIDLPRKPKSAGPTTPFPIPAALLDELVKGPVTPAEAQAGFQSFKQGVIERAMGTELSHHYRI
jgi:putative transposase